MADEEILQNDTKAAREYDGDKAKPSDEQLGTSSPLVHSLDVGHTMHYRTYKRRWLGIAAFFLVRISTIFGHSHLTDSSILVRSTNIFPPFQMAAYSTGYPDDVPRS